MSSAERPADVMRQAEAEMRRRAQDPHHRPEQRDQFAALADLFGHLAAEMAFGGARDHDVADGRIVVDSEGHERPEWADYLTAARAWLVPTPVDPR